MPIDYKRYPPNWKELRGKVLERAKNRCEFCGAPNKALIQRGEYNGVRAYQIVDCPDGFGIWEGGIYNTETGESIGDDYLGSVNGSKIVKIVLTIAHLDHDVENHNVSIDRLRALCQRCHLKYDKPVRQKKRTHPNLFEEQK